MEPRPLTVDELRPYFQGHETALELALTRYHLAAAQAAEAALREQLDGRRGDPVPALEPLDVASPPEDEPCE